MIDRKGNQSLRGATTRDHCRVIEQHPQSRDKMKYQTFRQVLERKKESFAWEDQEDKDKYMKYIKILDRLFE